ncbi:uncharacterized protein [Nothobranchius furzeri]|uniref:LOC107388499-like protein n=1 Tax=Nothobranchius furzeri TaxID=105023 RepID=A0A9D3BZP9_NOTFU|nr:uncharacterized protein LOC107388499 [Nothobranchius furzeri]KAF7224123.1 putative LOC107388499-like protein [Nothobranchius furzeri]
MTETQVKYRTVERNRRAMASVYSLIIWVLLIIRSSWSQCETETFDDTEFSINVPEHIEMESTDCRDIIYQMIFPKDKVRVPYKTIVFQGDPSKVVGTETVNEIGSHTERLRLGEIPTGKHEFGFKLAWGCNQTYIFPKRVHVSVTASTKQPSLRIPTLVEGQSDEIRCLIPHSCSCATCVRWKWTKADGQSAEPDSTTDYFYDHDIWHDRCRHKQEPRNKDMCWYKNRYGPRARLYPTADLHNTNITCVVEFKYDVIETTSTLNVKFPPRILKDSHCMVKGKLLVCVCISWGNPLSTVIWPLESLTDYSITSSSSNQTVISTMSLAAAELQNTTVRCVSSNTFGQDEAYILVHNSTDEEQLTNFSDEKNGLEAALPWITAACFSLNLVFITILIICIYQRIKNKKKLLGETNTYASLRKAAVEEEYSTISPQPL